MDGRSWKVQKDLAEEIRRHLLSQGGIEEDITSANEEWRIKFSDSVFIYYKSGTLYSTASRSLDPSVENAWNYVNSCASTYIPPSKDFLIGLDETGKGEIIGHIVLVGVIFPKEIFHDLDLIAGAADTKKRHTFNYWDEIFRKLDSFRNLGLDYIDQTIPPWQADTYNINKIMDVVYQGILSRFFRRIPMEKCRIVIDDYNVGPPLYRFLNFLKQQKAEVIVVHNADKKYLEAKISSLISKRKREEIVKRINENPEFKIDGISPGSGNANDKDTLEWLKKWYSAKKEWPWFVKKSFRTVMEVEGNFRKIEKKTPPIREDLLSKEFIDEFNKGRLSIKSLSIVCPYCGNENKSVNFAIFEYEGRKVSGIRCPSCRNLIGDAGVTLRYYCGYLVPDSSVIRRGLLSKDLDSSRFFEGFTILLPAIVRRECDTEAGKREFKRLADFASIGRIKLESIGKVEEIPTNLLNIQRDEMIVETAEQYNAILITADNGMKTYSISKGVFTISI